MTETAGRTRRWRLDDMLDDARRADQYIRLGAYDPREDDPEAKHPYEELIEDLEAAIAEARELRGHRCEFGEDDYCVSCGLDGRA